jgi:hypothetical protein
VEEWSEALPVILFLRKVPPTFHPRGETIILFDNENGMRFSFATKSHK